MAFALDTNLLVLLVVGKTNRTLVDKHKNTRHDFDQADYDRLLGILGAERRLVVVPHVLAETSSLLRQHREPERGALMRSFSRVVGDPDERHPPFREAALDPVFARLGLTDATVLGSLPAGTTLLTTDLDLFLEAQKRSFPAINFNWSR
mgnify:CR=1 FL=1